MEPNIILVHLALRRSAGWRGKKAIRQREPAPGGEVKNCVNTQYNAIEYAQQLEAAGVTRMQAELHAKALGLVVSHCDDVREVRNELSYKIAEVRTELLAELVKTEARLRVEILASEERVLGTLRAELHDVELRLSRRIDRIEQKLRFQNWSNGLLAALIIGLYVQSYFR